MARGDATIEKAGRPHINHNTMQHRQLLTPGPIPSELKIKASPYQESACRGSSKRKADCEKAVSSGKPDNGAIQSSTNSEDLPAKALKMMDHKFAVAGAGSVKDLHAALESNIYNQKTAVAGDSQINEEKDEFGAHSRNSTYQQTRERELEKHDNVACETSTRRVLRPRTKQNNYQDPESSESGSTSGDQAAAAATTTPARLEERRHEFDEEFYSDHLCTGLACEYPGCFALPELGSFPSASLLHEYQVDDDDDDDDLSGSALHPQGSLPLPHEDLSPVTSQNKQHVWTGYQAAGDQILSLAQSYQRPLLLSVREMAAKVDPEVHFHLQAPDSQDHHHQPELHSYAGQALRSEDDQAITVEVAGKWKYLRQITFEASLTCLSVSSQRRLSSRITHRPRSSLGIPRHSP